MIIGSTSNTNKITKNDIISKISEADIIGYYLNIKKIPIVINNPWRKDEHPSLGINILLDGTVVYKDFSTGEQGDGIAMLMNIWCCNRIEAYKKIQKDLLLIGKTVKINHNKPKVHTRVNSSRNGLKVKIREWRQYDLDYWEKFGITLNALKWARVYPISHKFIIKGDNKYCFPADKLAYCFYENKEGKDTLKCYQPMNKKGFKWSNSHTGDVIGLWQQIDWKNDFIYICSSLKDALTLKCNLGINVVYIQGEAMPLSNTVINLLKDKFNNVIISFDGDKAGVKDAIKLSKETGFKYRNTPLIDYNDKKLKDWAEIREYLGKEKFIEIFNNTVI